MSFFDRFQYYFILSWKVVKLDEEAIDEVSKDKKVLPYVILISVIPPVVEFLLLSLAFRHFWWKDLILLLLILSLSLSVVWVIAVLGKNIGKFKNPFVVSVEYRTLMRPALCAGVVAWLVLLPFGLMVIGVNIATLIGFLNLAVGVWTLVVYYKLLRFLYRLTPWKSVLVLIISLLIVGALDRYLVEFLQYIGFQSQILSQLVHNV